MNTSRNVTNKINEGEEMERRAVYFHQNETEEKKDLRGRSRSSSAGVPKLVVDNGGSGGSSADAIGVAGTRGFTERTVAR